MVDDPNTQQTTNTVDTTNLDQTTAAANNAAQAFTNMYHQVAETNTVLSGFQQSADTSGSVLSSLTGVVNKWKGALDQSITLTQNQADAFSLLSTYALGARKSFDNLANIDYKSLNTFSDQWSDLVRTITDGGGSIGDVINTVEGALGRALPGSVKSGGIFSIVDYLQNLGTAADNALRARDVMLQLGAATGNLDKLYQAAGPNLSNINELFAQQMQAIDNVAGATGVGVDTIRQYYTELGKVPGGLEGVVKISGEMAGQINSDLIDANSSVNMLTASILLARGTGRDYASVVGDLSEAFKDYGLTGEQALTFTARMTDITNTLGIDFNSVHNVLLDTTRQFREFADAGASASQMSEGIADIYNRYADALKQTGLSGNTALDVVQNITHAVGGLTIAQKAFLSSQTGGPGGLMGAFQIEKMMREGNISGVFDKVRQQMQKQFGSIVTLDQAAASPAAAAQLTRQMTTLKQGPLGQFARTDQEAYRILEAFQKMQTGQITTKGLTQNIVQQNMDKGVSLQQQSYTEAIRMRVGIEKIRDNTSVNILGQIQKTLTPGAGITLNPEARATEGYRQGLKNRMMGNVEGANEMFNRGKTALHPELAAQAGSATNTVNEGLKQSGDEVLGYMNSILDATNSAVELAKNKMAQAIEKIRGAKTGAERDAAIKQLQQAMPAAAINQMTPQELARMRAGTRLDVARDNAQLATMARERGGAAGTGGIAVGAAGGQANTLSDKLGEIVVNVKGYCIRCKNEIEGGSQVSAVSPVARRSSPSGGGI